MYRDFDDEVFLAPESIIAEALTAAALEEDPELPDVGQLAHRGTDGPPAGDADADTDGDVAAVPTRGGPAHARAAASRIDPWCRHADDVNGFGG